MGFSMRQPIHFFGPKGLRALGGDGASQSHSPSPPSPPQHRYKVTFAKDSYCNTKKGDRSLLGINYLCVAKMKYRHLTPEQRYTIDVLLQQKMSRKMICETVNISQSTLCRELKRNSGQRGYHHKQAQVKADDRKRRLQNYRNLTIGLRKFIRERITQDQWSPAQIVGHLRKMGKKIGVR